MASLQVSVDIWSDFVCPWCFLCSRQLSTALIRLRRARPDLAVSVRWRPHALFPDMLEGKRTLEKRSMYEKRLGSAEKVDKMERGFREALRRLGEDYSVDGLVGSTVDAHRLCLWARERFGDLAQWQVCNELFRAYHTHGLNLADRNVLENAAKAALGTLGEEPDRACLAELHSMLDSSLHYEEARKPTDAEDFGLESFNGGVPHVRVRVGNVLAFEIPGAQGEDYFFRIFDRMISKAFAAL